MTARPKFFLWSRMVILNGIAAIVQFVTLAVAYLMTVDLSDLGLSAKTVLLINVGLNLTNIMLRIHTTRPVTTDPVKAAP